MKPAFLLRFSFNPSTQNFRLYRPCRVNGFLKGAICLDKNHGTCLFPRVLAGFQGQHRCQYFGISANNFHVFQNVMGKPQIPVGILKSNCQRHSILDPIEVQGMQLSSLLPEVYSADFPTLCTCLQWKLFLQGHIQFLNAYA